jgi:hypothetical protein
VVGIDITGRSPGQIDVVVGEGERGARIFVERIEIDLAPDLPAPRPGTDAVISLGPPNFSTPVVIANACRC